MRNIILIYIATIGFSGLSQTTYSETNSWFMLLTQTKFTKKTGLTLELHERMGGVLKIQGQTLIRPSIDYHLNTQVVFSLGYSNIIIWPYAPYSQPIRKTENNLWEQMILKFDIGKFHFQNRFRQENRWVQNISSDSTGYKIDGTVYSNRFRFRWNTSVDLKKFPNNQKVFITLFNEIWFNQNEKLLPTTFGRNWLYLGLGYAFSEKMNVQLGYMNQHDQVGNGIFINSPIIQTSVVLNLDFQNLNQTKRRTKEFKN